MKPVGSLLLPSIALPPGRSCLFCGGRANSVEHVWPTWVLRRLRRPRVSQVVGHRGDTPVQWTGIDPAVRVRCLCRTCNQGWLSALEVAARPVIGSLIQDIAMSLDLEQQRTAAAWAMKMSMMIEGTRRVTSANALFYSKSQREAFRIRRSIPIGSTIWIGRYQGARYAFLDCADGLLPSGSGALSGAYVSTFAAGCLAIQVLSIRLEHTRTGGLLIPQNVGDWDEAMLQVWPPVKMRLAWPPAQSFADLRSPSFDTLTRRWAVP